MRKKFLKICAILMAAGICLFTLTGCSKKGESEVSVEPENPSGVPADELDLTEEQMVAALTELARRTENQMLATDPYAKVEFRIEDDGSCGFYMAGTNEDGSFTEEMEEASSAASVRELFASYYNVGFFDTQGNVLGFPDEVAAENYAQEPEDPETSAKIRATVVPKGGNSTIAGFPGEDPITIEDGVEVDETISQA